MMKLAMVAIAVMGMVGCTKYVPIPSKQGEVVVAKTERQLSDQDKIALLDAEAKKRGLRWRIFCYKHRDEPEKFQGVAEHLEAKPDANYVDEGRMDEWMDGGHDTQGDAAFALYIKILGPPTHVAQEWWVRKKEEGLTKVCLRPELKGNWKYKNGLGR